MTPVTTTNRAGTSANGRVSRHYSLVIGDSQEVARASARAGIIGPIRQECLSGLGDANDYARLRTFFRTFVDIPLISDDYELAASFFNSCRAKGIQWSHIDFLICAVADRERLLLYTTDRDFNRYAKHIPVRRFVP